MWVRNADARGTEAVKLSVKWLAGLAVLALAVVAVVGSTSTTKAVDGSIFVVNEWSQITNESPAPTGRTSRSQVYATIADGTRLVQTDADFIRVVVKDADLDTLTTETTAPGDVDVQPGVLNVVPNGGGAAAPGSTHVIDLTNKAGTLIAGTLADVQATTSINADIPTSTGIEANADNGGSGLKIIGFFAGDAINDPWIQVQVQVSTEYTINSIVYNTSGIDTVQVTVKSDLETTGIMITAEETGLSTGIFEGFVQLVDGNSTSTVTANGGNPTLDGTIEQGIAGTIRTIVGPITVSFDEDPGAGELIRQTTALVDTSAPVGTVSGPASGSATQNRRPTFSGTIAENGSGLDVSSIEVAYDSNNDQTNAGAVAITTPGGTGALNSGATLLAVSTAGALDGDTAFSFSQAPTADLPNNSVSNPDHIVDWVIKAVDLAGNIGLSDADGSTAGIQLPTVKVDTVIPAFSSVASEHKTGVAPSSTATSGEVASRNTLRLAFNDQLTNVQASDFTVTLDSGAVVVPTAVTILNNPTKPAGFTNRALVYLTFANDLVSNDTPNVALQDTISDLAGNFTSTGSVSNISDGIGPSLTVTLSDGSGTGTGSEGPDSLTKSSIKITIESDEPLNGAPSVEVFSGIGASEASPSALAQGANRWTATFTTPGVAADSKRAVKVVGTDVASNQTTVGGDDVSASGTPQFLLDKALARPSLTVGGGAATTDQRRPSIIIDYKTVVTGPPAKGGEASTVTLKEVKLDGTDITADVVAASDGKRFFYVPPSDLSLGEHKLTIDAADAVDAAGNEGVAEELVLTIQDRKTFDLEIFAGWNAISFPSDPIDPALNSVFTNAGHDAVLGFDPSVPGGWRVAVRDTVSGELEPATEGGLTGVRSTQAYWVHSNNFEQVNVLLVGEVLPSAGSPPGIITIPTVAGFNAVPIVDTSRKLTTGSAANLTRQIPGGAPAPVSVADYLGAVSEGRVYKWNPEILSFELLAGGTTVTTGLVLFVEVTGTPVPIFP